MGGLAVVVLNWLGPAGGNVMVRNWFQGVEDCSGS